MTQHASNHLENVCSYNYLGVIIDDKLSFREFVDDKYTPFSLEWRPLVSGNGVMVRGLSPAHTTESYTWPNTKEKNRDFPFI